MPSSLKYARTIKSNEILAETDSSVGASSCGSNNPLSSASVQTVFACYSIRQRDPRWSSILKQSDRLDYVAHRCRVTSGVLPFFASSATRNRLGRRAFFLAERRRHYQNLNSYVFKRILSLQLGSFGPHTQWFEGMKIGFANQSTRDDPTLLDSLVSSPPFDDAHKHLEIDLPALVPELLDFQKSVHELNQEVDRFESDMRNRLIERCSKFAPVWSTNVGIKPEKFANVGEMLVILQENRYMPIYYRYLKGGSLNAILAEAAQTENFQYKKYENDPRLLLMGGRGVAYNLTLEQDAAVVSVVQSMRQDAQILQKVVGFADRRKQLDQRLEKMKNGLGDLVYRIDAGEYRRTVKDCQGCKVD
jgi:hypothetical protein